MIALEARALEKLDSITLYWADLVVSKPSKVATIPSNLVALILDMEFS